MFALQLIDIVAEWASDSCVLLVWETKAYEIVGFSLLLMPQFCAKLVNANFRVQVLCHVLPSLVKLRKEGLDGHEKIKGYMYV